MLFSKSIKKDKISVFLNGVVEERMKKLREIHDAEIKNISVWSDLFFDVFI